MQTCELTVCINTHLVKYVCVSKSDYIYTWRRTRLEHNNYHKRSGRQQQQQQQQQQHQNMLSAIKCLQKAEKSPNTELLEIFP